MLGLHSFNNSGPTSSLRNGFHELVQKRVPGEIGEFLQFLINSLFLSFKTLHLNQRHNCLYNKFKNAAGENKHRPTVIIA